MGECNTEKIGSDTIHTRDTVNVKIARCPNILMFELLGVILKKDDPLTVVKKTIEECRLCYDGSNVKDMYELFLMGRLSEHEFWNSIGIKDYSMPRKLILEKLEYSLDEDFVKLVPSLIGKKICVKGDIPMEWVEHIFDSSGLSSMIHMYLFSYDIGKKTNDEEVYNILKLKFENEPLLIIESDIEKYEKNIEHGFRSALMLRKATVINGIMPRIVITRLEELENLIK